MGGSQSEDNLKYKLDFSAKIDVSAPSVTGSQVTGTPKPVFMAWQPSTWPVPPARVNEQFIDTLKRIFEESILGEIHNVINDAKERNGNLQHRGHVVAISLMCALDAISSYGYGAQNGRQIPPFIRAHLSPEYHPHADEIRTLYRNALVHSWNLFEAAIYPDQTAVKTENGTIAFGLLNLFDALVQGTENFLKAITNDMELQENALKRYSTLRETARP